MKTIDALAAYGSMTRDTASCTHWIVGALAIAEVAVADMERVVTRERMHRWYADGMSAEIAASSVRSWIHLAGVHERADGEARAAPTPRRSDQAMTKPTSKTAHKRAIRALPNLRASLLWFKREVVRALERRAEESRTPAMCAFLRARAAKVRAMELAALRADYQAQRVREIGEAPLFALGQVVPGLVRLAA